MRRRLRLHLSTWVILVLFAVFLFLIIVPGEFVDPGPANDWASILGNTFEHGWPWVWLRREYHPLRSVPSAALPHHGIPWLQREAWTFQGNADWAVFRPDQPGRWPILLLADLAVAIGICISLGTVLEWRRARRPLWRLNLAELFGLTLVISIGLAWWVGNKRSAERELRIWKNIHADKGFGDFLYVGPRWLRRTVGTDHLSPYFRAWGFSINDENRGLFPAIASEFSHVTDVHLTADDDLRLAANFKLLIGFNIFGGDTEGITDAGLAALQALPALERIHLRGPNVTADSFTYLKSLPNLKWLDLTGFSNPLDRQAMNIVAQQSRLVRLTLWSTPVNNDSLAPLGKLSNLQYLDLRETKVDGDGLIHLQALSQLRYLDMYGLAVHDEHLRYLESLDSLREIHLVNTYLTPEAIERLRTKLPNCNVRVLPVYPF
jgi:hypothetical protein